MCIHGTRSDGFVGLLGESFVGSSDSELGSMAFYIKKMEAKTLMCDIRERIEEERRRSAGHCSIVHSCIYT